VIPATRFPPSTYPYHRKPVLNEDVGAHFAGNFSHLKKARCHAAHENSGPEKQIAARQGIWQLLKNRVRRGRENFRACRNDCGAARNFSDPEKSVAAPQATFQLLKNRLPRRTQNFRS
jgi:hypothetical protein